MLSVAVRPAEIKSNRVSVYLCLDNFHCSTGLATLSSTSLRRGLQRLSSVFSFNLLPCTPPVVAIGVGRWVIINYSQHGSVTKGNPFECIIKRERNSTSSIPFVGTFVSYLCWSPKENSSQINKCTLVDIPSLFGQSIFR